MGSQEARPTIGLLSEGLAVKATPGTATAAPEDTAAADLDARYLLQVEGLGLEVVVAAAAAGGCRDPGVGGKGSDAALPLS